MNAIWLWGILGLVLLGLEMATGTFYIFWFGIAGLLLALLVWIMPNLNVALQILLFALLSLGLLFLWQHFYKKSPIDSRVGQSQGEEIGRTGMITEAISPQKNGKIQFAQGVMGSREWTAIANEILEVGAEAEIIAIEGNALKVKRILS